MKEATWLLVVAVAVIAALTGAILYSESRTCHDRAEMMRLESKWGVRIGCMVHTGDRWAPIEYIRIVNGDVSIQGGGE